MTYTAQDFSCEPSSGGQVDCTVTDTVTVGASDVVLSLERTYEVAPGFCLPVLIDGSFAFNTCNPGGGPYSQARSDGGGGSGGGSIGTVADVVIQAMSLRGINLKALQAALKSLNLRWSLFRTGARGVPQAATAIDPNKLQHIFGRAGHNPGGLVEKFGSQGAAFRAVESATQATVNTQGLNGVFETTVSVGGHNVVVRGNVMEGVVRIGTFFIP